MTMGCDPRSMFAKWQAIGGCGLCVCVWRKGGRDQPVVQRTWLYVVPNAVALQTLALGCCTEAHCWS